MATLDEVASTVASAKRAAEAKIWYDGTESHRARLRAGEDSTALVGLVVQTHYGSATRGAKEMNYYLSIAATQMKERIISMAVSLYEADIAEGEKLMKALETGE